MRVEDISPNHLLDKHKIALLKDVGLLLSKVDEFVEVDCPACGETKREFKFSKYEFNYWDCPTCKSFYISPRPPVSVLKWFYHNSYTYQYFEEHIFSETEANRRKKIVEPRVDKVLNICKENGVQKGSAILEIGSAYGTFLKEVESRNYFARVVGVEANEQLAKKTQQENLDVFLGVVEDYDPGDQLYDVVVCFEVLEHLFSPSEFVKLCSKFLKKDGLLILSCPNGLGFEVLFAGVHSDTVDHEHLNYLNPDAIKILFEQNEVRFIHAETPGKLDLDYLRLKYEEGHPDLKSPFLKFLFEHKWDELSDTLQKSIADLKMSTHMMAVGKKI